MKIPEYFADQYFNAGIRHIFGIPGGPSIPWIEAFREAGVEFILTSHEGAAGVMAAVTGRLTGVPGLCHSTYGPGATNISTGTGAGLLDRSPMIVLTSEMSDAMIHRTAQMNIDHQALFAPLVKASFRLSISNIREVAEKSLSISCEEYPGPVHIGLPSGIDDLETDALPVNFNKTVPISADNDIDKIIQVLKRAKKPALAIGLTAARHNIRKQLEQFLLENHVPVFVTPMAREVLHSSHPAFAGVLFHAMSDYIDELISTCDLVIGLGYDPVEFNYESWVHENTPLIHFDTRKVDMPSGMNVIQYCGSPADWFKVIMNLPFPANENSMETISAIRKEMTSVFNGFTGHFGPAAAIRVLRDELPSDTILSSDVGSHLHLLGQFWDPMENGKFLITNGWSSMGFGIPAAIAAGINNIGSTVVCVTGDGGFLMSAGELMTARRYNIPVIIVVFSDGELNLIRLKQSWKDVSPYGTTIYHDDLFGSDIFLGIRVLKATSAEGLRRSINKALSVTEPVIINAVIDPEDYKWMVVKR
jgi:acetolactate synthase I/II/III large subunit